MATAVESSPYLDPARFNQPLDVVLRHVRRYLTAVELLGRVGAGETWVDYGCGSGYGTVLLANFCQEVTGVDMALVISAARHLWGEHRVLFSTDEPYEKVSAYFLIEVIEHIDGERRGLMLKELTRGPWDLVVSTPIVPQTNWRPTNPHHEVEFSFDDFCALCFEQEIKIVRYHLEPAVFTDGEEKEQGYFLLRR